MPLRFKSRAYTGERFGRANHQVTIIIEGARQTVKKVGFIRFREINCDIPAKNNIKTAQGGKIFQQVDGPE